MSILVTGGSGFVGLNLVEQLLGRGEQVVVFAAAAPPDAAGALFRTLPGHLTVIEGDVRDGAAVGRVFAAHPVRRVIHAAVITSARARDLEDPETVVGVNLLGTLAVLEAARRHDVDRLIYVSSGAVYGPANAGPAELDEATTPALPEGLYGITKYAAERASLGYKSAYGLDVVAARLSTVFGRWEYDTGDRDTLSPPLQIARLAAAGTAAVLPREGRKDWIYGADVARGILALLDLAQPRHDVYHVSTGQSWSLVDWCRALAARRPGFTYRIADRPGIANVDLHGDRDRPAMAIRRLVAETGFAAQFDLDAALADYLEWTDRHQIWRSRATLPQG